MAQQDLNAVGMRILDASRAALMIELPYLNVLLCALQSRNGEDVTSSIATDGQGEFGQARGTLRQGIRVEEVYHLYHD